jgi:predicted O-methyltransferase YrrM
MHPNIKKTLDQIAKERSKNWNIDEETGLFLNNFILSHNIKSVLEIGTSTGFSGIWIAEALSQTNGHLYTIESHKIRFEIAKENFEKSGLSKHISQIFGHAPEIIPEDKHFDLAFFDATKYEHLSYFEKIKNQLSKGAHIIIDNLNSHRKELTPFLDHLKTQKNLEISEKNIGSGLLIIHYKS